MNRRLVAATAGVSRRGALAAGVALIAAGGWSAPALAQAELRIGLASEPSSFDPHYHNLTPNNALTRHVYEPLVAQDEAQKLVPGLAASWRAVDERTWEFSLRRGVTFHDGKPLTADDVLATMERVPNVPRSPSSFASFTKGKTFTKVDDLTVRVTTEAPSPLVPVDLSQVPIVPASAKAALTEDFNAGRVPGTGPYRFEAFTPGERVVLRGYGAHWAGRPAWERVTFRPIASNPTRVAAVLAGDVDVIEAVPTSDVARLKGDKNLTVASGLSNRVIYFHLDHFRDDSPFIKGKDGSAIKNPLKNARVRRALSMAINRPAIVARVMENEAVPAGQLLPDGFFGVSPRLKPAAFDLDAAKKLLAEAGYPNGFKMTLHGPNGRYTNDTRIIEAVAQMLTRLGIEASVETLPPAVFFTRASRGAAGDLPEFSFILVGWSAGTGENSDSLKSLLATFDAKTGLGATNRGRYSNAKVDALVVEALRTVDEPKRAALLAEATDVSMADVGLIPLHYQLNSWAARKGFKVVPRTDEYTLATSVTPAP